MRQLFIRVSTLIATALLPLAASAGAPPPNPVPEPGTWALIALAGAIGFAVSRNKRK